MIRLVLVGGGHAQLSVLQAFQNRPMEGVALTLISPSSHLNYSGMLPGWMAGHYATSQCRIDLVHLAQAARAHFILTSVVGLDAAHRTLRLQDGRELGFDLLSLDTGSSPGPAWQPQVSDRVLPVRPLDGFYAQWPVVLSAARSRRAYHLVVVGGGAGGIEIALAARQALHAQSSSAKVALVASEHGLLAGHSSAVQRRVQRYLATAGIDVHRHRGIPDEAGVLLANGVRLPADCVIPATGAQAPAWLQTSGLSLDSQGYVQVDPYHRSVSHPWVFAAGDVCARSDVPLQKSGVHAVRAGPVVAHNLMATINDLPLRPYEPKPKPLYLLACGPRYAIASWGAWSAEGYWVWKWKDWIDRRFVSRFTKVTTPKPA